MNTQVIVILAIVVVVIVVAIVWYTSQHPGPHLPWTPIGQLYYNIKSKSNGQYLQWRTGVWVLSPHPGDGDLVTLKNSGFGTQILYDHPSGKVLLPPNGTAPVSSERRVVLGDSATLQLAMNYNPNTLSLGFGTTYDLVLAGNKTANPFVYAKGFDDQQWVMDAVAH